MRYAYVTDMHKRTKDITTIRGYTRVNREVQLDVMKRCKELEVNGILIGGDWYDSGYGTDIAAALTHTDIDIEMFRMFRGNVYSVIGNHIRINMDSNPELFLVQPHPYFKSRHSVSRNYQIFKTPSYFMVNGVQISLVHHNRDATSALDYYVPRQPEAKYHIALYHTEMIIPTDQLHKAGLISITNENSKIAKALEGVDLALVGHVHKPLGTFNINKPDGTVTTMIVPGSITNTDAGLNSRHTTYNMPIIDISEDGNVSLSFEEINLRTNELTFIDKGLSQEKKERLKTLRGNNVDELYPDDTDVSFISASSDSGILTLNKFLQEQGYTDVDKRLISAVLNTPEDIASMVRVFEGEV